MINNNITKFPKPLDWFQKKIWRIQWIEWCIFIILFLTIFGAPGSTIKKSLGQTLIIYAELLFAIPFMAIVMTLGWKYFFIGPFKLAAMIPGFGKFAQIVVIILTGITAFIGGINDGLIIERFCEEIPKTTEEKYKGE